MAPPRRAFSEDPELEAVLSGGSFAEDPELDAALGGGGKVIQLPVQQIEGEGRDWVTQLTDTLWPQSERSGAQQRQRADLDQASQHFADMATPKGMASKGAAYLANPLLSIAGGSGVMGNALASGASAGLNEYAADPNHDPLDALLAAGGGAALGGTASAIGAGAGALRNRARMGAFNATNDDLRTIGQTPQQFSDMTDRLGANNAIIPQSRTGKLARVDDVLSRSGQAEDAAIAAADQAGVGANRDWGGEIARDIDLNADRVRTGGSGQRDAIMSAMRSTADAAEAHPMDSLQELRRYKTARAGEAYTGPLGGLAESAAGKASLAAADSAGQHLDISMRQAGPELNAQFEGASRDFSDGKILEELLLRRQNRTQYGSAVADAGAATAGAVLTGGNPLGAGAGVLARRVAAPYAADAAANMMGGVAGAANTVAEASPYASGALGEWFGQKGVRMEQPPPSQQSAQPPTPAQLSATSRGNLTGKAAEQLLQSDPAALGKWAPEFAKAAQAGTVDQLVVKLVQNDPEFRTGPYLRLQALTSPQSGGVR